VEAAALERAAGIRKIQPLAPIAVIAVRLAVVDRRVVREDGLFAIGELREPGPDMIEARLQSEFGAVHDFL